MAFNVTVAQVQQLAGVPSGTYDTQISFLITLITEPYTLAVDPALALDGGAFQMMSLACVEMVAGELVAWLYRQPGYADELDFAMISVRPYAGLNPNDPSGLKAQGMGRMHPYLRHEPAQGLLNARIALVSGKREDDE
ncbi:MAG: hypothetical protein JNJ45_11025 [Chthonomonas sp.]|nr:hypothetical protein [Chthonomonas sp.]